MKKNIDTFAGLLLVAMFIYLVSLTTGCHSRIHTDYHYSDGELVHKNRTRAYSLFGKSEATRLQGDHEFTVVVGAKTNLSSKVSFGTENEKKAVDSEGLKAAGEAGGNVIGEAGEKLLGK